MINLPSAFVAHKALIVHFLPKETETQQVLGLHTANGNGNSITIWLHKVCFLMFDLDFSRDNVTCGIPTFLNIRD